MSDTFERLQELNLTRDEVNRIGEALKKPEFRKLLSDYVEEIQDPKNKELYEKEITELEKERGNDITFIHPKPCYVIKTSVDGNRKGFVNVCSNELVGKPSSTPTVKGGEKGLTWSLPHSLSPPREDVDNKRQRCQVFDVIFHPDTLHLANKNKPFRDMVNKTALEAVENNFNVILDKKNLKFPKLSYKGIIHSSVIRKPSENIPEHSPEEREILNKLFAEADKNQPAPKKHKKPRKTSTDDEKSEYTIPKYFIKHRSHVEMEDFTEHKGAKLNAAIPKELVVDIMLPLLKSSADITLDVTEKTVQLVSENPAKYKLNLTLPYRVNDSMGSAKFDKDKKKLVITLPVKRNSSAIIDFSDSGVESDQCSRETPESEEDIADKHSIENNEPVSEVYLEKSVDFRTKFLDESLHYNLPEFTCHLFENSIAFTLNVKNVDDKSVDKILLEGGSCVHIKFTSIGSSFYPSHYSFYVKFSSEKIDEEQTSIEVWDNNVILQLSLICDKPIMSYFYGSSENDLLEKYVEEPAVINQILEDIKEEKSSEDLIQIKEQGRDKSEVGVIDSSTRGKHEQDQNDGILNGKQSKAIDIVGTSYESSGDELSCSSFSPSKNKGILKRISSNRFSVGRSISESSLDNYAFSSYENCYTSLDSVIPEDGQVSSSEKKTVRFNDVVMSQLFRSNSSILGQKKKNQRKARNKKRAMERRHSESEASGDEKKEGDLKDCDFKKDNFKKYDNIFHLEVDN
ncbi:protein kintoun isoform X1 [Diorhabda carinulata]|uniref:protein kintoun isoform X1 n=1 Tax=Diorhabda carinulata TaxID=1163345 RepID=UPI0025A04D2B|nr:protein kintoun isoform X1 [Diorhabda carinulata]